MNRRATLFATSLVLFVVSFLAVADSTAAFAEGPTHQTALVDPAAGLWRIYDSNGLLARTFYFGNPGDYPIVGDWDCDGVETPGLYRQSDGYVYLRNSNTQGVADTK